MLPVVDNENIKTLYKHVNMNNKTNLFIYVQYQHYDQCYEKKCKQRLRGAA